MFKTVRKGDASLQYTILPQTDQFIGNSPLPQPPDTRESNVYKFMLLLVFIATCFCTFAIISSIILNAQRESNSFAVRKLEQVEYNDVVKLKNHQSTTTNSIDVKQEEVFPTNNAMEINSNNIQTTTENSMVTKIFETPPDVDDNVPEIMDTITDYTSPGGIDINSSPSSIDSKNFKNPELPLTVLPLTTIDASSSSKPKTTVSNYLLTNRMNPTNIFKRAKMPRVTLKLRENDTIPKMYMKAGIASYKKGNITTSVLAHGLSLEGLIFKTPEGTIKPWSKKCAFSQSAFRATLKRYCEASGILFTLGLTVGVIVSMLASVTIIFKYKVHPVKSPNVEEPPLNAKADDEEHEDRSKLLEPETKLINEKDAPISVEVERVCAKQDFSTISTLVGRLVLLRLRRINNQIRRLEQRRGKSSVREAMTIRTTERNKEE
ncbi:hypothetical protein PV327_007108 [Microctonus hyperodae]|uniref:Uncharacterized protein n=1 Tax=Microctonus hyperodae TaxID=165561 RepID=A0AA39F5N2_MICHY|nr:hypothetical protein PV327_007108 [Microctonus hyperodae]